MQVFQHKKYDSVERAKENDPKPKWYFILDKILIYKLLLKQILK